MSLVSETSPRRTLLIVGGFVATVLCMVGYMLYKAGVDMPLVAQEGYLFAFETQDIDNLVPAGDVLISGVRVGSVQKIDSEPSHATVHVEIDDDSIGLHKGVQIRVGAKSLIGESYVDIIDGTGTPVPSGTTITEASVIENVALQDVVESLDAESLRSLKRVARSLGNATDGNAEEISQTLTGLGYLGRQGYTAIDAIAAQNRDLVSFARRTTLVLQALDASEGQIGDLVRSAQRITSVTNEERADLESTVQQLPGVLFTARQATDDVVRLAAALGPVVGDLRAAAPAVSAAMRRLPGTTADLRTIIPDLEGILDRSPATLDRLPAVSKDVRDLIPVLRETMSQVNPMLAYLEPYGPDLAAFAVNFNAVLRYTDEAGVHYTRLQPIDGSEQAVKASPMKLPRLLTSWNPHPAPGDSARPGVSRPFPWLVEQAK